jgi:hypothetical protein
MRSEAIKSRRFRSRNSARGVGFFARKHVSDFALAFCLDSIVLAGSARRKRGTAWIKMQPAALNQVENAHATRGGTGRGCEPGIADDSDVRRKLVEQARGLADETFSSRHPRTEMELAPTADYVSRRPSPSRPSASQVACPCAFGRARIPRRGPGRGSAAICRSGQNNDTPRRIPPRFGGAKRRSTGVNPLTRPSADLSPNGARLHGALLRDVGSEVRCGLVFTTSPLGERSAEGRVRGSGRRC